MSTISGSIGGLAQLGERGVRNAEVEGSNPLPSTIFRNSEAGATTAPAFVFRDERGRYAGLAEAAALRGHILWTQVDPSLTWLPFRRMRSLHLGQVPIMFSLSALYTTREDA